jgi:hypothetical protein
MLLGLARGQNECEVNESDVCGEQRPSVSKAPSLRLM